MEKFLLLNILFLTIISCTREANDFSKIKIKFPEKLLSSKSTPLKKNLKLTQQSENSVWGLEAPVSVAAADCFGVYAAIPDSAHSSCVSSSGTQVLNVNKLSGMVAAGSDLEIELPSGKSRVIGIFAFKSVDGTCSGLMDANLNTAHFSAPLSVGETTIDLSPGTVGVQIPLSIASSKSIEKCTGGPLVTWPAENSCTPSIAKMISTNGGELNIEGSCLTSANSLAILNSSTNEKYSLNIISRTATKMSLKLASSLTMNAGVLYKLIITTSKADVVAPISLQLGSSLVVKSNGTKLGSFITTSYMMYMGSGVLMETNLSFPAAYFQRSYTDSTGSGVVQGKYYLYNSLYNFSSIFQNLTIQDLLAANVITQNYNSVYALYFSGPDCTGDLIIPALATEFIKGIYFVLPSGCTPSSPYNCANHIPKKITSSGTFQAGAAYQSRIETYSMGGSDNLYCTNYSSTQDAYVFPAASIVNLDANDPPAVIDGVIISH